VQSALNLRLALASFGLVFCAVIGILAYRAGYTAAAVLMGIGALVAIIDVIVILKRRATRRKQNPNRDYSLFE
jgi:hypothetical protein